MKHHVASIQFSLVIFGVLLALLLATIAAAYVPLGPLHFAVAMGISIAKAVLIALYFMHLKFSHRFMTVVFAASLLWLGIMIALTLSDTLTRDYWVEIPGK
jgi:cytochrome c oxidase subunit 4